MDVAPWDACWIAMVYNGLDGIAWYSIVFNGIR